MGRSKKEGAKKCTYFLGDLVIKMIELYAAERHIDKTAALSSMICEHPFSLVNRQKVEEILRKEAEQSGIEKSIGG